MKIDTLILSGCGPSGIAYTGVFKALLEKGIMDSDLDGIQEIITTSIGILFSVALILGLDNEAIREIVLRFDVGSMLNCDDVCIDSLLVEYGLYETDGIRRIFRSFFKNIMGKQDVTLMELYQHKAICLTVKVFNVTRKQIEYISYETEPNLSVVTLAEMTTAIPIFFKPVMYNGCLYTDGGLRGSFPIERCSTPHYLGICLVGITQTNLSELDEYLPIAGYIMSLLITQDQVAYDMGEGKIDPRIIYKEVGLGLDFHIDDTTKKRVIQEAYETTLTQIEEHLSDKH
jgi:predicted acylesterase/phospholipase RssA